MDTACATENCLDGSRDNADSEGVLTSACVCEENDEMDDAEKSEREHFEMIVNAFRYYKRHALIAIQQRYLSYSRLPERHRALLHPHFPSHLTRLKDCAMQNAALLRRIVAGVGAMFENSDHSADVDATQLRPATDFNMEKLQSTLRQIVRDWSAEGASERKLCYQPVVEALLERFAGAADRSQVRVLVPGAGLGRLAFDLARLGFTCQGNEFSLFMLFVSNFILNRAAKLQHTVYPYIHQTCNVFSYADQLRAVQFPDVSTDAVQTSSAGFSMAAGDFLEVYERDDSCWDAVATVFFIDTAANMLAYMDTILRLLKPGGVWVNLGPLLYHYAEMHDHGSVELPYDEVVRLVGAVGFELHAQRTDLWSTYTQNADSMLHYRYRCGFFVAVKPVATSS